MNLWIRSQDKESITKISNIQYTENKGQHFIATYYDNLKILGQYKTKERALEVLDEIQKYIEKQGINEILVNHNGIPNGSIYYGKVYEMPKE